MNVEIIKELVSVSNDKKNTILFFLQPKEQQKLKNTELIDKKSIYLDNKIYLVKKNTLELKYNGKLQYYKNNYFYVENIKKPLKSISAYSSSDIQNICLQINIPTNTIEGKKLTKKEIEYICNEYGKNKKQIKEMMK